MTRRIERVAPRLEIVRRRLWLPIAGGAPDFPSVADTNTSTVTTQQTSHTVNLPPNISSGNLLVLGFALAEIASSISWPVGYTKLGSDLDDGQNMLSIAYRHADGTEGASITVTTGVSGRSAHVEYRITGHKPSTAPERSTGATSLSENPDPDSLTPAGGAKDYLWLPFCATQRNVTAAPGSYTDLLNPNTGSTSGGHTACGSARRQLNAASEDPGAFTATSAEWSALTVAVVPADVVAGNRPRPVLITRQAESLASVI